MQISALFYASHAVPACSGLSRLHPKFRKQGLGRLFAKLVYQEFLKQNIFYVLVEPATPDGLGMSDSIGFQA